MFLLDEVYIQIILLKLFRFNSKLKENLVIVFLNNYVFYKNRGESKIINMKEIVHA